MTTYQSPTSSLSQCPPLYLHTGIVNQGLTEPTKLSSATIISQDGSVLASLAGLSVSTDEADNIQHRWR